MNLSIYLPPKLDSQLEALEEWLTHHYSRSSWPPHFFDFQAVKEAPDFSIYN